MLTSILPTLAAAEGEFDPLGHVLPYTLFNVGPLEVTNHLLMAFIAALLVIGVFVYVASRVRVRSDHAEEYITKGRVAQVFEVMCIFIREEVVRPNLGKLTDKYISYIWTVFFFILFCNVLGMVPFAYLTQTIAWVFGAAHPADYGHWSGTPTSNLALNGPLALVSLAAIIYIGIRENGKHFFAHFAPVPFKPLPMALIAAPLVVLEVLGVLIRSVVLAMRLFGTMLAGHLVLAALFGMIFIFSAMSTWLGAGVGIGVLVLTLALALLELFIALLQAFIFTFLTVLFISEGATHHEEDGPPHEEPGGGSVHEMEEEGFTEMVDHMYGEESGEARTEPAR